MEASNLKSLDSDLLDDRRKNESEQRRRPNQRSQRSLKEGSLRRRNLKPMKKMIEMMSLKLPEKLKLRSLWRSLKRSLGRRLERSQWYRVSGEKLCEYWIFARLKFRA